MMRVAIPVAAVMLGGCATSSLVLLPDEDGGQGAVAILESGGTARETVIDQGSSRTSLGSRAPVARPLGRKGLRSSEAALIGGLPPAPRSFLLYFEEGTTTLTQQSQSVLGELRAEIAGRSGAEVEVTGHTDTVGSEADNDRLSTRRAEEVMGWLASQGFDRSQMSAVGRGERELKVPTVDNIDNAANRRVEVIVR
jgi:outer membrane protein OmpA-like peptidoglycan-associated protein